jgi:putative metallohydrolase (TIGR04338 family)
MRKRRDTQRLKVYRAGWETLPNDDIVGTTVTQTQAYVDKVCDTAWFRRRWGTKRITVQFKKGLGGYTPAYSNLIVIGMNATARLGRAPGASKATVLHEMAHVVTGHCDGAWHGPEFTRNLLELVSFEFGPLTADNLKAAYRAQRATVGKALTLKPADATPAPRPALKVWRIVVGDKSLQVEATSIIGAMRKLDSLTAVLSMGLTAAEVRSATDIRIYKSRRVTK